MPWSNQGGGSGGGGRKGGNGGPWGSGGGGGGGGPWGSGGGGGGGGKEPPDLDEILRRGQDRMKQVMRGGGPGGPGAGLGGGVPRPFLFLIAMLALLATGFYGFFFRVNPDEQGVVLRFGKYDRWEEAGLHFRWPYPIEEVLKPKVTQQRIVEVGAARGGSASSGDSGLMLTGDGTTIVDVGYCGLRWRIKTDDRSQNSCSDVRRTAINSISPRR
jgi:membrane protease subunit HflK